MADDANPKKISADEIEHFLKTGGMPDGPMRGMVGLLSLSYNDVQCAYNVTRNALHRAMMAGLSAEGAEALSLWAVNTVRLAAAVECAINAQNANGGG